MENNQVKLIPREIREVEWPVVRFLSDEEQSKYEDSIKKFSGKAYESLNIPKNGSNLFKVLLLNQLGIKTATLSDLELALENGMELKGTYEDTLSVVLRSSGDSYKPNDYLAKLLAKKIKKKNFKHSLVLNGLELKEDENSAYGLVLIPGENFNYFEAPELDHENNYKKFSKLDERGMPIFDKEGERTLYTKDKGLVGVYVLDDLGLVSYDVHLASSVGSGRVVVKTGEAGSKIFDGYLSRLKQEKEKEISELESRFDNSVKYLKTGKL